MAPCGRTWSTFTKSQARLDMKPLSALSILLVGVVTGRSQSPGAMVLYPVTEVEWKDGPASMPRGAKMAVLEGDPTQAGMFTVRLRFPDGFRVPPHWHTQTEHVTVVAGALHLGMGERFDRAGTRKLAAGSF